MSVLSEKDVNSRISASASQQSTDEKLSTVSEKDVLKKSSVMGGNGTYISPSDAIQSPASKKLAVFKQKQISRQNDKAKRSLFARTMSSNSEKSDSTLAEEWK